MHTATDPTRKPRSQSKRPRDLRDRAFAVRTYPHNPEAAARMREVLQQQPKKKQVGRRKQSPLYQWPTKEQRRMAKEKRRYPLSAYKAAEELLEKSPATRRYGKVFTPEVVVVWLDWLDAGKSIEWIAAHNGLIPVSRSTAESWIDKHRTEAERLRASKNGTSPRPTTSPAPEPAQLDPEPESALVVTPETAVTETAVSSARPVRGLAELLRLLDDDGVRVSGRVKVELDIEF